MSSNITSKELFDEDIPFIVACYGTLRYGHGNWQWALADAQVVALSDKVYGYTMSSSGQGSYRGIPAVFESTPDDYVVVDVFDTRQLPDQEKRMKSVDRMEFGCGYFRRLVRTDNGHDAWLYVMPDESKDRFPHPVASGDWNVAEGL